MVAVNLGPLLANSSAPSWSFPDIALPIDQSTTFNVTATDQAGNVGWQTITLIQGGIAPRLVCPPNQVIECGIAAPEASGVQLLNCISSVIRTDNRVATCGNAGLLSRTFTAPACSPIPSPCVQQIQFLDRTPPVVVCPASLSLACTTDLASTVLANATLGLEACGTATLSAPPVIGPLICGQTATRTFAAVDACSNRGTCTQTIVIA